jgi:hypothetical protein
LLYHPPHNFTGPVRTFGIRSPCVTWATFRLLVGRMDQTVTGPLITREDPPYFGGLGAPLPEGVLPAREGHRVCSPVPPCAFVAPPSLAWTGQLPVCSASFSAAKNELIWAPTVRMAKARAFIARPLHHPCVAVQPSPRQAVDHVLPHVHQVGQANSVHTSPVRNLAPVIFR